MSHVRISAAALATTFALAGATAPGLAQASASHFSATKCQHLLAQDLKKYNKKVKKHPKAAKKTLNKQVVSLMKHGCKIGG